MLYVRRVVGKSMEPALYAGDILIARKVKLKTLRKGDIVIATSNNKEIIKRITMIDGDDFYLCGDNSAHSTDSRKFGAVKNNQIIAKYWYKLPRKTST